MCPDISLLYHPSVPLMMTGFQKSPQFSVESGGDTERHLFQPLESNRSRIRVQGLNLRKLDNIN